MAIFNTNPFISQLLDISFISGTINYKFFDAIKKISDRESPSDTIYVQLPEIIQVEMDNLSNSKLGHPFKQLSSNQQIEINELFKKEIEKAIDINLKIESTTSTQELLIEIFDDKINDLEFYNSFSQEVKTLLNQDSLKYFFKEYHYVTPKERKALLAYLINCINKVSRYENAEIEFRKHNNLNGIQTSLYSQALIYTNYRLFRESCRSYDKMNTNLLDDINNNIDTFSLHHIGFYYHETALEIMKNGDSKFAIEIMDKSENCSRKHINSLDKKHISGDYILTGCNLSSALINLGEWMQNKDKLMEGEEWADLMLKQLNFVEENPDLSFTKGALLTNFGQALFRQGEISIDASKIESGIVKLKDSLNHFTNLKNANAVKEVELLIFNAKIALLRIRNINI